MNYVGKPLAYVLATPEQPDDADNPLRVAFGNEAGDRDIDEFARRFGCVGVGRVRFDRERRDHHARERHPARLDRQGLRGRRRLRRETVTECAGRRVRRDTGRWPTPTRPSGELVNTQGAGYFSGYYNDQAANDERMRHGMYWSGDLAYRDADGWVYLAGRTADWMRVDGENIAAAPIERILMRLPAVNRVAVYAVPDDRRRRPGDGGRRAPGRRDPDARQSSRRSSPSRPTSRPRPGPASSGSPATCRARPPTRCSSASWSPQGATAGDG